MIKQAGIAAVCAAVIILITGCMDMLLPMPEVESPENTESSMLILQLGIRENRDRTKPVTSSNHSAWIPWVTDLEGDLVRFKASVNVSDLDTFFYSENLKPGTYIHHGFAHIYIDYGKLGEGEIARYGPYEGYPYHVKQDFPLDSPRSYIVSPSMVISAGRFLVSFEMVGGTWSREDDRYRVIPDTLSFEIVRGDTTALEAMKSWTYSNWEAWSQLDLVTY